MSSTPYDWDFVPGAGTRETTNYANLARDPATRRQNLAMLFRLINQALNLQLTNNRMPRRFPIELNVLSLSARFEGAPASSSASAGLPCAAGILCAHARPPDPKKPFLLGCVDCRDGDFPAHLPSRDLHGP